MQQRREKKMKQVSKRVYKRMASFALTAILIAGATATTVQATDWKVIAGSESPDLGNQALAFLPNELWVHTGDTVHWTFATHEKHTLTFLKPGQTRPAPFGSVFGVEIGCPGTTPDGSSFDGSSCLHSGAFLLDDAVPTTSVMSYSVRFPSTGNFKFVCLFHADMTGQVHVLDLFQPLPHNQDYYDREAHREQAPLLAAGSLLQDQGTPSAEDGGPNSVAAGNGQIMTTTGAGSVATTLMRFARDSIVVHVGDTVEWINLNPSVSHTVTFGTEPADPRTISSNVQTTSDGARLAIIGSPTDSVNSGYLTPTPQDRQNLAQASPNVTRFRVTFTFPGTFNYICALHDVLGMKGTVTVNP
jgi:plastocyanin